MELVYLWVEDYKNIKKQGFNFSSKFICNYNEDNNKLTIDDNPNHIENFFGDNINVTAIVGKNGSGKSTLLEIISLYKFELKNLFLKNSNLILIYEENNILYPMIDYGIMHDFIFLNKQNIINNTKLNIQTDTTTKDLFILSMFSSGLADFSDQNHDYNSLKSAKYDQFYNGFYISYQNPDESIKSIEQYKKYTDCLLRDSQLFNFINEKFIFDSFNVKVDFSYDFKFNVFFEDLQADFDDLYLKDSTFEQKTLADILENQDNDGNYKKSYVIKTKKLNFFKYISYYFLDELLRIFTHYFSDIKQESRKGILRNFIYKIKTNINNNSKKMSLENYIELIDICIVELEEVKIFVSSDEILKYFPYMKNEFFEYYYNKLKILKHYKLLYKIYDKLISINQPTELSFTSSTYLINKDSINIFSKKMKKNLFIQELYRSNIFKLNYINTESNLTYNFLSTGEKQFFNFIVNFSYTMLYSPKEDLKHIVVFLDEVDLSLHPKWQKKFFNILITLLDKIRKIKPMLKIHLIFTTHSPFLLSDIPKENIIFLNDKPFIKQTFGANIHTLLSDSFFMEDGLMGEFAKGKINEIIEFHKEVEEENKKAKSNFDRLKAEYEKVKIKFWDIQSIIGEEYLKQVIKNHLRDIESLLGYKKAREEEIKRLRAEADRLEKM